MAASTVPATMAAIGLFLAGGVVHTLKVVCGTDIYAGLLSSGGVSRSTDDGMTWTSFSTGLPNTGGLTVRALMSAACIFLQGRWRWCRAFAHKLYYSPRLNLWYEI